MWVLIIYYLYKKGASIKKKLKLCCEGFIYLLLFFNESEN